MSVPLKHVPAPDRDENDSEQRLGTVLDVILSEFNKLGYKTVCGIALKDIYIKHSKYSIEVDHDELKKQFFEFLRPAKKLMKIRKKLLTKKKSRFWMMRPTRRFVRECTCRTCSEKLNCRSLR